MRPFAELLEEARGGHGSFHEDSHPPTVIRRQFSRAMYELASEIAGIAPAELRAVETMALPFSSAQLDEGVPLENEYLRLEHVEAVRSPTGDRVRVTAVPPRSRYGDIQFPAVWFDGARLFLVGGADAPGLWRPYSELRIEYIPAPPELAPTEDGDEIDWNPPLERMAERYLIAQMHTFMATRRPEEIPRPTLERILGTEDRLREGYLLAVLDRDGVTVDQVREVWP